MRHRFPIDFFRAVLASSVALSGFPLWAANTTGQWSGSIEAKADLDTPEFSRHETQTWTLTGAAPTLSGSIALYPARWHYSGVGAGSMTVLDQSAYLNWTIEATHDVQIAIFVRASDNRLTFHQWTPPVFAPNALTVTSQTVNTGGGAPNTSTMQYPLNQWVFNWLEGDPTKTDVSGSDGGIITLAALPAILHYTGRTQPTVSCTWHFTSGASGTGQQTSTGPVTRSTTPKAVAISPPPGVHAARPTNGNTTPATPKPAQDPANFKANQSGEGQVDLSWDAVSGVTTYLVLGPGATDGTKVNATTLSLTGIPAGDQQWRVTSWYTPDGSRTKADTWPTANLTLVSHKNHYRVTATHVLVNHEELDDLYKGHGKINEIFVTSFSEVFDRRTNATLSAGPLLRTPIHGDVNNSDPQKGIRVRAGSVSGDGGIQTGDDVHLLMSDNNSSGYYPFVAWEGDLTSGVEAVVLRPMVWVVGGTDNALYSPYSDRVTYNESPANIVRLAAVQAAIAQSTALTVDTATQLTTTGGWNIHTVRPMGIVLTSPAPTARVTVINPIDPTDSHSTLADTYNGTWSDRVIVLTREKLESFLSTTPSRTLEVHVKGNWTAIAPLPLGECTLYLQIERL